MIKNLVIEKMKEQVIQTGAEAVLIRKGDLVLKRRVRKGYRLPELDGKLRKLRTRSEARLLDKVGKLVSVPRVEKVDDKLMEIDMEFIDGKKLSESLDEMKEWKEVCFYLGKGIGKLHDAGIIHGDLTTSNMIFHRGEVYFIDFGLGFGNGKIEDKAVDLHLMKRASEARHFVKFEEYWKAILNGYKKSRHFGKVMKQLEKVEGRGRYKQSY